MFNWCVKLGWGTTDFAEGRSNVLQKISVSVITNKDCRNTYRNVGSRQLCTLEDGKDACQVRINNFFFNNACLIFINIINILLISITAFYNY